MFNYQDLVKIEYIYPLRLLVYCVNLTLTDISRLETKLVIPPYYYFIVIDQIDNKIKLFTFENLKNLTYCHERQESIQINEFSSSKHDWIQKPVFPKKYTNFYGCEMSIAVIDTSIFLITKDSSKEGEGLINYILDELSFRLKFTGYYYGCNSLTCKEFAEERAHLYNIAEVIALDGYAFLTKKSKWNFIMINVECA